MKQVFITVMYSKMGSLIGTVVPFHLLEQEKILAVVPFDNYVSPEYKSDDYYRLEYPIEYIRTYILSPVTIDRYKLTTDSEISVLHEAQAWELENVIDEQVPAQPQVNVIP